MNDYPEGMPCWAPGAAPYLARKLTGEEVAFEWGGGASSIWLAPKIRYLYVMETSLEWAERIIEGTEGKHCGVWVREFESGDYLLKAQHVASGSEPPTMWLIDGFRRIDCLALVRELVSPGDLVVLDDALDYAEDVLTGHWTIERFAMEHPHAGKLCKSAYNDRLRNTVRTHAPETKETWVIQV